MTRQAERMRLGVFGGAFDPPHVAHRALAEAALDQLKLARLHVVPTGQAWHKSRSLTDAHHRVAMAQLAFAGLGNVHVDTREVDRPGPSYTIDTVRELLHAYPGAQLFLIIGQDQAQALTNWREWEHILELVTICVAARAAAAGQTPALALPTGLLPHFETLHLPLSAASATEIRHRASLDQGIVPLVGEAVARYIVLHRLYLPT